MTVRPVPWSSDQPYSNPSQDDAVYRTSTIKPGGGQYDPYAAYSARGSDYATGSGPWNPKPSQYDQEYRNVGRRSGGQYDDPCAAAAADQNELQTGCLGAAPGSAGLHASEFNEAYQQDADVASGGKYTGHGLSSPTPQDEKRRGPAGRHALTIAHLFTFIPCLLCTNKL